MNKSGKFIKGIRQAVKEGRLIEPFRAKDVRGSVPGFAYKTYNNFLSKHKKGNTRGETELFIQISRGLYRLL